MEEFIFTILVIILVIVCLPIVLLIKISSIKAELRALRNKMIGLEYRLSEWPEESGQVPSDPSAASPSAPPPGHHISPEQKTAQQAASQFAAAQKTGKGRAAAEEASAQKPSGQQAKDPQAEVPQAKGPQAANTNSATQKSAALAQDENLRGATPATRNAPPPPPPPPPASSPPTSPPTSDPTSAQPTSAPHTSAPPTSNAAFDTAAPLSMGQRFEAFVGGKLPIWIGGIALIFAGFFLVRFSIEAGLFGPGVRCISAMMFGLSLIAMAEFGRKIPRFGGIFTEDLRIGHSLAGAGIAVLYAALYMASEIYGLVGLIPALIGLSIVTILAFFLSDKHGAPTAIMGLMGGFAAPYVAGLGADSLSPLLIYLGMFTAGIFGLAIHRGWTWLALLATGGSLIWSSSLLFMDVGAGLVDAGASLPLLGMFIVALAMGGVYTLSRTPETYGLPKAVLQIVPLAAGMLQLMVLAPLIEFSLLSWLFFGLLAVFSIALAWRDEDLTPAVAGSLGLALVMVMENFSHTPHSISSDYHMGNFLPDRDGLLTHVPAMVFALIYGVAGHIFLRREKSGWQWALIALAGPTGMLFASTVNIPWGWNTNIVNSLNLLTAINAAIVAWRAWEMGWMDKKAAAVLPIATFVAALFLAVSLSVWMPEEFIPIIIIATAAGLAAWGEYVGRKSIAVQSLVVAIWAGLLVGFWNWGSMEAFSASMTGETDLFAYLPAVGEMVIPLLLPALVMIVMAVYFRDFYGANSLGSLPSGARPSAGPIDDGPIEKGANDENVGAENAGWPAEERRGAGAKVIGVMGGIGVTSFAYLLYKQPLSIGPIELFRQYGFAERALLTHLIALIGWLAMSGRLNRIAGRWIRSDRGEGSGLQARLGDEWLAEKMRIFGLAIAGLALFRFVYFDLLLLNPLMVGQALGPVPIANLGTMHYGAVALWMWFFARESFGARIFPGLPRGLEIGSLLAAIVAVLISVRQLVHGSIIASPPSSPPSPASPVSSLSSALPFTQTETYLYSAALMILAIIWLMRGIRRHNALLRIAGLALLTVVTFKVFLLDAARLDGVLRILSFFGLGVALIGIGWIYGKLTGSSEHEVADMGAKLGAEKTRF